MKVKILLLVAAVSGLLTASVNAADVSILFAYTQRAADMNGGSANLDAKVNSAISTGNQINLNTFQGVDYVRWRKAGWYRTSGLSDNRSGGAILSDLSNGVGGANQKARDLRANLVCLVAETTDVGGVAYQPGQHSVIDAQYPIWNTFSHEIGHSYNASHEQGLCWTCNGRGYNTVMAGGYCSFSTTTIKYYSTPAINLNCRYIGDSTHNNAQRIKDIRWTRSNTYF
jgi:hypothetical protein